MNDKYCGGIDNMITLNCAGLSPFIPMWHCMCEGDTGSVCKVCKRKFSTFASTFGQWRGTINLSGINVEISTIWRIWTRGFGS